MRNLFFVSASVFALSVSGAAADPETPPVPDGATESIIIDGLNDERGVASGYRNKIEQSEEGSAASIHIIQAGEGYGATGAATVEEGEDPADGWNVYIDQNVEAASTIMVTQHTAASEDETIGNSAAVLQGFLGGDTSSVDINQDGSNNTAYVDQGAGGLTANVAQVGNENMATVIQTDESNFGDIKQWGDMNMALLDQTGTGNTAVVEQGAEGEGLAGSGNDAMVLQSGINDDTTVLQRGNMNFADVKQQGSGEGTAFVWVAQGGNDNRTEITQD